MCFADAKQGVAAANYVKTLNLAKIGVFYQSDIDYSKGIRDEFVKGLQGSNIELIEASFTTQTASDFTAQVAALKDCEFIFMPIYYTEASLFMTMAKDEAGIKTYYGCDGLDGLESILDISTIPQAITMLTHFKSDADNAKDFVTKYTEKYGTDTLNQFGASAYDCVYAIVGALKASGEEIDGSTSASDICDILKAQLNGGYEYTGAVTGTGSVKWTAEGFVNKDALVHVLKEANG